MARSGVSALAISFLFFAQYLQQYNGNMLQQMQHNRRDACMYVCYRYGNACNGDPRCFADERSCLDQCNREPQ